LRVMEVGSTDFRYKQTAVEEHILTVAAYFPYCFCKLVYRCC
jgi:hypothetical protein